MSAKAKAMFGERLKANDYQSLLQKKSVSEIAAYLKNNTYYKATLDGINETQIHRGHASIEQIHSLITEKYVNFTKKQMDNIIDNIKADDIYDRLKKSYYGAFMDNKDFVYIEYHTKAITFNIQRKTINFSSNPDLIM